MKAAAAAAPVALALVVAAASPASAALINPINLLANGDFEIVDGRVGRTHGAPLDGLHAEGRRSWDVFRSLPGRVADAWTTLFGPGIEVQTNRTLSLIDSLSGFEGVGYRYVELDSHGGRDTNSAMVQEVLLAPGRYELSFWYSPRSKDVGRDDNLIAWWVEDGGTRKLVEGMISGPERQVARGAWTEVRAAFDVVSRGPATVGFAAGGRDNSVGGLLDNVRLSALQLFESRSAVVAADVPLPAAAGLLGAGLGGLALLRRRRRRRLEQDA